MPHPERFYPVVDSLAWVERLTGLGVGTVQLRVKDLAHDAAVTLVREALAVTRGTGTELVVNDYWRAAIEAGAQHLHLGQEDLAEADVGAIRAAGLTLGLSTHDDEELATALRHEPDYVALGPIYPTTLKAMRFAPQGSGEDRRMEAPHRRHPARRHRRHHPRARACRLRRRRRFHRRRQRRDAEPRSRRARARLAGSRARQDQITQRSSC